MHFDGAVLKIVLPDFSYGDLTEEKRVIAAAGGTLVANAPAPPDITKEVCRDADAIIARRLRVDRELLSAMPRCKAVVKYGVGVDDVDLEAATAHRVFVGYVPRYGVDEVSNHAIALMLCAHRQSAFAAESHRGGLLGSRVRTGDQALGR